MLNSKYLPDRKNMNARLKTSFSEASHKAKKIINSPHVHEIINEAESKANRNIGRLLELRDSIRTMIAMIQAWYRREYKSMPKRTIVSILAALIYFINPFDAIPDFLAGVGLLDDAAILGFVINSLRNDIEQFRAWQSLNQMAGAPDESS